jgi:hypothetical protein
MKKLWIVACLFAILPIFAFAASAKSKTVSLDQNVQVAGQQLKAGDYKLKWDDSGSDTANVTIYNNSNKEVATVPARIVHQKNTTNASYEVNTAGGSNQLDRVYFSNEVLEFGNAANPGM